MKLQPDRSYDSNDVVQTPVWLAEKLVAHFKPYGKILEPCCGEGNILRFLPESAEWCEISKGRDFFEYREGHVDWIITNPPWSLFRRFLGRSLILADQIVFLVTVNHLWTRARIAMIFNSGFGIKEIRLVQMPTEFPPSGFQLGAIHLSRGWSGDTKIATLL
jgi:hypothetical protein